MQKLFSTCFKPLNFFTLWPTDVRNVLWRRLTACPRYLEGTEETVNPTVLLVLFQADGKLQFLCQVLEKKVTKRIFN